ncbi:hypothetical protein HUO13_19600 [Saccharopolyspora erythraea]|uniref:hypothetical protein n=1 Tax=Saccharopolyspora erythraea TaxID=1836 RepID=UPI001BAAD409|nr:hypothetical protein [Saccharopolyspora erythraea]QUH02713.1 hypothetical protein HUO13_19600 [Saccharopolyspora erythraea]
MRFVLGGLVVSATLAGLLLARRGTAGQQRGSGWRNPGAWLLLVVAAVYLNQVLFTVHVLRVWDGDAGFVARYLPAGWLALADDSGPIRWLAERFPRPDLLSWSVLRVQALLELPLVVLAYLTVCRWFGADVFGRAARQVWALSASWTITFCLVEWSLHNPYTADDIVLRAVSGLIVPIAVAHLRAGRIRAEESVTGLVSFVVSAAAAGYLVLAVYDTALLYNLGHLGEQAPGMAVAAAVLVLARIAAHRVPDRGAGPRIAAVAASLGWFLVLFAVPALPIRYSLNFGLPVLAAAAGTLICAVAVFSGVRVATRGSGDRGLIRELVLAVVLAAVGGYAGFAVTGGYPEARLLAALCGSCAVVVVVCAVGDRFSRSRWSRSAR